MYTGIKGIKGMSLLLVRQAGMHSLCTDVDLGRGEMGKKQGLTLLCDDFGLPSMRFSELEPLATEEVT